mmetsp:Transcript_16676/g.21682  ORF Transcript_16676/g.21682 Transcript_16676/m.21682 type:complete len:280 (+) Transcript_16676:80-919(+)
MVCYIQIVFGPAGSGKSTYCKAIQDHCMALGRRAYVANLDPAAESFGYDLSFDIRDLISVDEVMEELELGPNGALMYAMEYLLENLEWLEEQLDAFLEDDYLLIDCPGQLELYTHQPIMRRIIEQLRMWGYSHVAGVFLLDATFVCDAPKFMSGVLLSLSTMISLELPHINVLSKCDLLDPKRVEDILDVHSAQELWSIEEANMSRGNSSELSEVSRRKRNRLTRSICTLIDDYSMVSFLPLDISDEESVNVVISHIDHAIQYGENLEVKENNEDENDG